MYASSKTKLDNTIEKKRVWIAQVQEWRTNTIGHPDYHENHPEEVKYRANKIKLDARIQKLEGEMTHYSAQIQSLECQL